MIRGSVKVQHGHLLGGRVIDLDISISGADAPQSSVGSPSPGVYWYKPWGRVGSRTQTDAKGATRDPGKAGHSSWGEVGEG